MVEMLTAVTGYERAPDRMAALRRHADLILGDGERDIATPADRAELRRRHDRFAAMQAAGPASLLQPSR